MLETNRPYLIPLKERLALPARVPGKANPKSSTGRARRLHPGDHRRQLSLRRDRRRLQRRAVPRGRAAVVPGPGPRGPLAQPAAALRRPTGADRRRRARVARGRSRCCSRHGSAGGRRPGARRTGCSSASTCAATTRAGSATGPADSAPLLDLTKVGAADPDAFWEPVQREDGDRIVLTPEALLPADVARGGDDPAAPGRRDDRLRPDERRAAHPLRRVLRPGLRLRPGRRLRGSTAALEVRAHDVPFMVEHGQRVCKLTFERMLEPPTAAVRAGHRLELPAAGGDAGQALSAIAEVRSESAIAESQKWLRAPNSRYFGWTGDNPRTVRL